MCHVPGVGDEREGAAAVDSTGRHSRLPQIAQIVRKPWRGPSMTSDPATPPGGGRDNLERSAHHGQAMRSAGRTKPVPPRTPVMIGGTLLDGD
ncbi:hypothetical protein GCM10009661_42220 [Catellatospora chokoriensis]